jgi:hypothetical protein
VGEENAWKQYKLNASLSPAPQTARGVRTAQGEMPENGNEAHLSSTPEYRSVYRFIISQATALRTLRYISISFFIIMT